MLTLLVGAGWMRPAAAQPEIRVQQTFTIASADTAVFLDYWVALNSISVRYKSSGAIIPPENTWSFDRPSGELHFFADIRPENVDSVQVKIDYRKTPFNLRPVYFTRELREFEQDPADTAAVTGDMVVRPRVTREDIFGSANLQRSGSLTRGITMGSNQDLALDSGLRFELSGNITDDVEVLATLTDQSTPIQPDGSTQNLREFDKVYIRLQNRYGAVQLGDVDVSLRTSEFAQVERRLQGVDVSAGFEEYGHYNASAAVVRGRFRVQRFNGREGVQGPYRLTGAEGEQFIIVLAGTERVYINGNRMTRGEENDYIIDYGLGEITFTGNRFIDANARITVDFQYVTQEYNRTLISGQAQNNDLLNGRLSVGATYIREADNKDLNTEFGLSDEEIRILREAGNDPNRAIISGADSVGFRRDADFILYARVDTTFQEQPFTIFKSIPGDSTGVWRVRFSRVGSGSGSYRRAESTVNGIVYEWVGPGLGAYEPFRRIPAPQEQQMIALRSSYRLTDKIEVYGEWAGSEFDRNRFSEIDNEDNKDMAYIGGIRMQPVSTVLGNISGEIRHRYQGENFAYFDRTREVEFDRKWNIFGFDEVRERITEGEFGLQVTEFTGIQLSGGFLNRTDLESTRQQLRLSSIEPGLPDVVYTLEYIQSDNQVNNEQGRWFRQRGETRYSIPLGGISVTPSFAIETEDRRQRLAPTDSLRDGSFRFYELMPGLDFSLSDVFQAGLRVMYRNDDRAAQGSLRSESESWTRELKTRFRPSEQFNTTNSIIIRDVSYSSFFVEEQQAQNNRSVLVRSVSDYRTESDFWEISLFYEGGTESRPLLQETYIEVGPELGNYVWIDLNGDGVQQIDEFFPAQSPNEGTFIRQFIPSDELFPVVGVNTRLRSRMEPGVLMEGRDDVLAEILRNVVWNSVFDIREQNRSGDIADILLFRFNRYQDAENTIDGRFFTQQDLQLFRPNRNLDVRLGFDRTKGLTQRASGRDELFIRNFFTEGTYRIQRKWIIGLKLRAGENDMLSERLSSRSFRIRSQRVEPSLRYEYSRSLQMGTGFSLNRRRDILPAEPARLTGYTVFGDARWFFRNKIQSFARVEFRSNTITGLSSSFGSFELTDGAGAGNTWQWSLQASYRISEFLRATLNYDGRTVTDQPAVQTLRFTMNAVF